MDTPNGSVKLYPLVSSTALYTPTLGKRRDTKEKFDRVKRNRRNKIAAASRRANR